ncbi:MAG: cytochrome c oxidase subunit II [Dehalococcoidia bacterium]|jgi:cytochrome c oxidase subunit II|nr:cytochrome c oxidase subunit II [Dehalococcoidia bacterium]
MRRDVQIAVVVWILITAAAMAVTAFIMDPFPTVAAEEADFIDEAFMVMTYMAAPVFGIVMMILVWGVPKWRTKGNGDEAPEDGPAILGTNWFPKFWFVVTAGLAVVVMIYPGLTGIAELRSDDTADMRVEVTGLSWQWLITYPDHEELRLSSGAGDELVLPVHTRIQFDVTALDVLHSFWIPAFRQKIDAVPGQTTVLYTTTSATGDSTDVAFRIQCAELCGLDHSTMSMPVRVVTEAEFEEWLASKGASAAKVSN